ncbi:MAG: hydrolase [Nitrosopumilus sp. H8]|nr:MAG: hydrolase [Nitrosopumilus sp. H8]
MVPDEEIIEAQKQVIGILFEVVKRFQANSDLDDEYFRLLANEQDGGRLGEILKERKENVGIIGRLLEQLET